jgi:hypothetical protein
MAGASMIRVVPIAALLSLAMPSFAAEDNKPPQLVEEIKRVSVTTYTSLPPFLLISVTGKSSWKATRLAAWCARIMTRRPKTGFRTFF